MTLAYAWQTLNSKLRTGAVTCTLCLCVLYHHFMILYSCINGSTVVDNYDESFLDTECELPTEVCDTTDDDMNAWSGFLSDMWDTDSTYERPSILF